eukprot:8623369-Lingulodinium_polyedra.AAC.1
MFNVADWGPVAWITKPRRTQAAQNHLQNKWQISHVLAELETGPNIAPVGIASDATTPAFAEPRPLDQHVGWLHI